MDKWYDIWRKKGYGVPIDRDVCIDAAEPEDDGKYYKEQLKDLKKI